MGSNFAVRCTNCGYRRNMMTMTGMAYVGDRLLDPVSGTLVKLIRSKIEREKIFTLLNDGGDLGRYGHRILICQNCGEFQEAFYYEVKHSSGIHVSKHACNRCGVTIIPRDDIWFEADPSMFKCPDCGKYSLVRDTSVDILWD